MEAVEVDAVPEARDTSHAACTGRVAPRGDAGAIDARLCCRSAPANASARGAARRALRSKERAGRSRREISMGAGDSIGGQGKLGHSDWLSGLQRPSQSRLATGYKLRWA